MDPERDKLVAENIGWVRALAFQLVRGMAKKPDVDELIAYGLKGLAEAAARYDPEKGAAFKTYSYYRIRGSMFDGLRATGWLARDDHARVKAQQAADDLLESAAAVPGSAKPDAVQAATQIKDLLSDVTAVFVTAYDNFDRVAADPGAEGGADAIEQGIVTAQTRTVMQRAIEALPERERDLVRKVYYGDQTIEDAGKSLGISKSWASRMHAKAMRQLKELLAERATDPEATG